MCLSTGPTVDTRHPSKRGGCSGKAETSTFMTRDPPLENGDWIWKPALKSMSVKPAILGASFAAQETMCGFAIATFHLKPSGALRPGETLQGGKRDPAGQGELLLAVPIEAKLQRAAPKGENTTRQP